MQKIILFFGKYTNHRLNIVVVIQSIGVISFRYWVINHSNCTIHTTLSINLVVGILTINTSSRRYYRLASLLDEVLFVILHENSLREIQQHSVRHENHNIAWVNFGIPAVLFVIDLFASNPIKSNLFESSRI